MGVASDAAGWPTSGLDEAMLAADPDEMFERWMADVVDAGLPEPTAMVLATVSAHGQPRARTVLLKGHDEAGFSVLHQSRRRGRAPTSTRCRAPACSSPGTPSTAR